MPAGIAAIASWLPERVVDNHELSAAFPEWDADRIGGKTGILSRHVAGDDEFASDLAVRAAERLFDESGTPRSTIDHVIVCTQTPDRYLATTAFLVHARLGLRADCGAVDIALGCSGYVAGLGLATGLIESRQARTVLLITADTYTKLLNPADRSVRTIFGDGAAATLVVEGAPGRVHSFVYGSDGTGADALTVPRGGLRAAPDLTGPAARGLEPTAYDLYMDGPEVFNFTLRVVPETVERLLASTGLERDDVDTWVFHQANGFMLGHLRRKLDIPEDRFIVDLADVGNTVSTSIPLALERAGAAGRLPTGSRSVLLGFGVGLAWAGAVVDW